MKRLLIPLVLAGSCFAAEIILPSNALERDAPVPVIYRIGSQATGKGVLTVKWTDVYGRVVEDRKIPVTLKDETEIGFTLDLRRAAAMQNELSVHFSFDGTNGKQQPDHREEDAKISFIAKPPDRHWRDYEIMMWQNHDAETFARLKALGINGGQYGARHMEPPEFLLKNDMRWYAESIATDYYSEYHRWRPDRAVNWSFLQAKELYKKDPSSIEAFKRNPSFSDPYWRKMIHDRAVESARRFSPYRPVYYSLADEPGIADLAAYWDFDFSDLSLVEMRRWLKKRYGTLSDLNRQWGTDFARWEEVTPQTTNQAMQRTDDNFSSWADFKAWMDVSFARALKLGVKAVESVDPDAYVAIGGGQMPGWGGYDYSLISKALTAIEPYDIGDNIEIIRSLNPKMAVVTTSFRSGPWEKHRVWYELLHGNRGMVLWDDNNSYVSKDGQVQPRGKEAGSYYNELRNGIASLLINSVREADPIAIHYSQASMRTEWMLAQKPKGAAWVDRGSARERMDSEFLRLRESYCRLIEDLGLQYNFVAYGQIEKGELLKRGYRVLILPSSSSISSVEAREMREFVEQGGVLIANGDPGAFDEHSRRLPKSQLGDLFAGPHTGPVTIREFGKGKAIYLSTDILHYQQDRVVRKEGPVHDLMGKLMAENGIAPEFAVVDQSGRSVVGVETHRFRNGGATIIGLLSNPELRVNELGPPEFKSNERFEKPVTIRLVAPYEMYAVDIRAAKSLGKKKEITVTLDPYEPAVFAFSATPFPKLRVSAPPRVAPGETGHIGISFSAPTPASNHVLRVDVTDPSGQFVRQYSGNVVAPRGKAEKLLPVAVNDPKGKWTVTVKDLLTGQSEKSVVEVP